jgi:putative transposase
MHGMKYLAEESYRSLDAHINCFSDVFIQDSTIILLNKILANKWPAARSKTVASGVKVSMLVSAKANGPKSVSIIPERTNDIKTLRIGSWIRDRIILINFRYYKYALVSTIHNYGDYFVSRIESNCVRPPHPKGWDMLRAHALTPVFMESRNRRVVVVQIPLIRKIGTLFSLFPEIPNYINRFRIAENRARVHFIPNLKDGEFVTLRTPIVLNTIKLKKRAKGADIKGIRLVAIYKEEDEKYHVYITNISDELLTAKDIAQLYKGRWEIELVFKELKSKFQLDIIETTNEQAIEAFIWLSILTMIVSRELYNITKKLNPDKKSNVIYSNEME